MRYLLPDPEADGFALKHGFGRGAQKKPCDNGDYDGKKKETDQKAAPGRHGGKLGKTAAKARRNQPGNITSAEQIAVGTGAFKADMGVLFGEGVDQNPVRLDMAIAGAGELTAQRMIAVFQRQWTTFYQNVQGGAKFGEVFPAFFDAFTSFLNWLVRLKVLTGRGRRRVPCGWRSV